MRCSKHGSYFYDFFQGKMLREGKDPAQGHTANDVLDTTGVDMVPRGCLLLSLRTESQAMDLRRVRRGS